MTCFSPKSSDIETFLYFFRITIAIIAKIAQYVYMAKLMVPVLNEIWRPIPGIAGCEASCAGRIRRDGVILTPYNAQGYKRVSIPNIGGIGVHNLVLRAFVGPQLVGIHARHLDCNGTNNFQCNLAYGTPKQNVHDAILMGKHYCKGRPKGKMKLQPYKREMAQKAVDAKKEHSTPYSRSAVNMGVPVRTLNGWVNALLSEQVKENQS